MGCDFHSGVQHTDGIFFFAAFAKSFQCIHGRLETLGHDICVRSGAVCFINEVIHIVVVIDNDLVAVDRTVESGNTGIFQRFAFGRIFFRIDRECHTVGTDEFLTGDPDADHRCVFVIPACHFQEHIIQIDGFVFERIRLGDHSQIFRRQFCHFFFGDRSQDPCGFIPIGIGTDHQPVCNEFVACIHPGGDLRQRFQHEIFVHAYRGIKELRLCAVCVADHQVIQQFRQPVGKIFAFHFPEHFIFCLIKYDTCFFPIFFGDRLIGFEFLFDFGKEPVAFLEKFCCNGIHQFIVGIRLFRHRRHHACKLFVEAGDKLFVFGIQFDDFIFHTAEKRIGVDCIRSVVAPIFSQGCAESHKCAFVHFECIGFPVLFFIDLGDPFADIAFPHSCRCSGCHLRRQTVFFVLFIQFIVGFIALIIKISVFAEHGQTFFHGLDVIFSNIIIRANELSHRNGCADIGTAPEDLIQIFHRGTDLIHPVNRIALTWSHDRVFCFVPAFFRFEEDGGFQRAQAAIACFTEIGKTDRIIFIQPEIRFSQQIIKFQTRLIFCSAVFTFPERCIERIICFFDVGKQFFKCTFFRRVGCRFPAFCRENGLEFLQTAGQTVAERINGTHCQQTGGKKPVALGGIIIHKSILDLCFQFGGFIRLVIVFVSGEQPPHLHLIFFYLTRLERIVHHLFQQGDPFIELAVLDIECTDGTQCRHVGIFSALQCFRFFQCFRIFLLCQQVVNTLTLQMNIAGIFFHHFFDQQICVFGKTELPVVQDLCQFNGAGNFHIGILCR